MPPERSVLQAALVMLLASSAPACSEQAADVTTSSPEPGDVDERLARISTGPFAVRLDASGHVRTLSARIATDGADPATRATAFLTAERELFGLADLRPAGSILLSGYEHIIPAAIAGQGVALGRSPLVRELLAAGTLVAPFPRTSDSSRAYFAVVSENAAGRAEVDDFVEWLKIEAAREDSAPAISRAEKRSSRA